MVEQHSQARARPRPGPRPNPSAHGDARRRTAHRATPAKKPAKRQPKTVQTSARSIPSRRTLKARADDSRSATNGSGAERSQRTKISPARQWLILAVGSIVAFGIAVVTAPFFEAEGVQISGAARTSEGAILEALAIPADQALLTYRTGEAAEAVNELAWVQAVSVTRQWPSTVRVVVRERTASASIGSPNGAEWIIVGEDGVAVETRMTPSAGVPVIVATHAIVGGSSIGEPVNGVERALLIARELPLQLDPWITTWSVGDSGDVIAELVGSASVQFGATEDHRTQYVSLASILNGGADLICLDRIDLMVADTPVLHRNPQCLVDARQLS
jgi:cell division protein FtsQ